MLWFLPQTSHLHIVPVGEELLPPNSSDVLQASLMVCVRNAWLVIISQLSAIKGDLTDFS